MQNKLRRRRNKERKKKGRGCLALVWDVNPVERGERGV